MNLEIFKKKHYMLTVLLVSTIITVAIQIYFVFMEQAIQDYFGEGGPGFLQWLHILMDPSILDYEGHGNAQFGGQDPAFILIGIALIGYLLSVFVDIYNWWVSKKFLERSQDLSAFVRVLGYIGWIILMVIATIPALIGALINMLPKLEEKMRKMRIYFSTIFSYAAFGFIIELSLKTFFARPRPGDAEPFVHAWQIGTIIFEDAYHGSFPSGHTFACAVLYIIPFLCLMIKNKKKKYISVITSFILVTIWSALMGAGRVHSNAHYASDNLWAIYFAFIYAYFFYFYIWRVEEQVKAGPPKGSWHREGLKWYEQPRMAWELSLLFSIVFFEVGCLLLAIGAKELVNEIFSLGLPMVTDLLATSGLIISGYIVAIVLLAIGALIAFISSLFVNINLKRRPSEITEKLDIDANPRYDFKGTERGFNLVGLVVFVAGMILQLTPSLNSTWGYSGIVIAVFGLTLFFLGFSFDIKVNRKKSQKPVEKDISA